MNVWIKKRQDRLWLAGKAIEYYDFKIEQKQIAVNKYLTEAKELVFSTLDELEALEDQCLWDGMKEAHEMIFSSLTTMFAEDILEKIKAFIEENK